MLILGLAYSDHIHPFFIPVQDLSTQTRNHLDVQTHGWTLGGTSGDYQRNYVDIHQPTYRTKVAKSH